MLQSPVRIRDDAFRAETLREAKRAAHDLVEALNDATKGVQAAQKRDIRRRMKVRRESFTMNQVKITQFASVKNGKLSSVLAVQPKPRSILAALEEDGNRPNLTKDEKPMAIPVAGTLARKSEESPATLLSTLALQKAKGGTYKGKRHAFLIPGVGVFERTGDGAKRKRMAGGRQSGDDMRLLWTLETRARLSKRLHFYEISEREFPALFARALEVVQSRRSKL